MVAHRRLAWRRHERAPLLPGHVPEREPDVPRPGRGLLDANAERVVDERALGRIRQIEAATHHLMVGIVEVLVVLRGRRLVLAALEVNEHRRRLRDLRQTPEVDVHQHALVLVRPGDAALLDAQWQRERRAGTRRDVTVSFVDDGRASVGV